MTVDCVLLSLSPCLAAESGCATCRLRYGTGSPVLAEAGASCGGRLKRGVMTFRAFLLAITVGITVRSPRKRTRSAENEPTPGLSPEPNGHGSC
jgi:hypothetical protein